MNTGCQRQGLVTFGLGVDSSGSGDAEDFGEKGRRQLFLTRLGLPVPPGFIIPASMCAQIRAHGFVFSDSFRLCVQRGVHCIERATGLVFGDRDRPLLLSVRPSPCHEPSYSTKSLLNIGLNETTLYGLVHLAKRKSFAWEMYSHFVQAYAHRALEIPFTHLEGLLADIKGGQGEVSNLQKRFIERCKNDILQQTGHDFPEDPEQQLEGAVCAFIHGRSYRKQHHKNSTVFSDSSEQKVALIIQAMVFGAVDDASASGCALTHHTSTGAPGFWGRYVLKKQVEESTLKILPPQFLSRDECASTLSSAPPLEEQMPDACQALRQAMHQVRQHVHDVRVVPFVIQSGRLWVLDAKPSLCAPQAVFRVLVDAVQRHDLKPDAALAQLNPADVNRAFHAVIDSPQITDCLATGLGASPGAACGRIVFSAEHAQMWAAQGEDVILVCAKTRPGDVYGLHVAKGIVTAHGGITSHAAVIARGMGRPCVTAVHSLIFSHHGQRATCGGVVLSEGDWLTIDGATGQIFLGKQPVIYPDPDRNVTTALGWADSQRRMRVRANCDTQRDALMACQFGADGIGLCRSEYMFCAPDRLMMMQRFILAKGQRVCAQIFEALSLFQQRDLVAIFSTMQGLPVAVRLLDPPLHEFLPRTPHDMEALAQAEGISISELQRAVGRMKESNPMLGYRGCRVGVVHPSIYTMQAHAVFEAAAVAATPGCLSPVEIIIPFVSTEQELRIARACVDEAAQRVADQRGQRVPYTVGVMIEIPRAALRAGDLARHVEFFSFGTNDLTQMTLGLSRDDAVNFMPTYQEEGIYAHDPFVFLEQDSVGELMELAVQRGRAVRPDLTIGICGEHGADPETILFCERLGLDYVSCSPYRVPAARLAAAQATLRRSERTQGTSQHAVTDVIQV